MQAAPLTSRAADDASIDTLAKLRSVDCLTSGILVCRGATCATQWSSRTDYRQSTVNIQLAMQSSEQSLETCVVTGMA